MCQLDAYVHMNRGGGGRGCALVGGLAPVSDLNAYLQPGLYSNLPMRDARHASLSFRSIWGGFLCRKVVSGQRLNLLSVTSVRLNLTQDKPWIKFEFLLNLHKILHHLVSLKGILQ